MKSGIFQNLFAPIGASKGHFWSLDLVRGIAALVVAIFHYTHFYYMPGAEDPVAGHDAMLPLKWLLSPIYTYGGIAVQIFWMISGFVFAGVYLGREASTRAFVVSRFARLYPLHLITLLVVAVLQYARLESLGAFQTYLWNDLKHFLLQLVFASNWGMEKGYSFNGPIWSVSVEVMIYALFWITLPFLYRRGLVGPAAACLLSLGIWASGLLSNLVAQCSYYFFAGTAVYGAFFLLRKTPWMLPTLGAGATIAITAMVSILPFLKIGHILPFILPSLFMTVAGFEYGGLSDSLRRIRWLGDSTYGIYLWHVPIQLLFLFILDGTVGSRAVANNPLFLLFYVAVVLIVAWLSFVYIERPARSYLNQWARPRERVAASS